MGLDSFLIHRTNYERIYHPGMLNYRPLPVSRGGPGDTILRLTKYSANRKASATAAKVGLANPDVGKIAVPATTIVGAPHFSVCVDHASAQPSAPILTVPM